jgi:hypothetical protein
MVIKTAGRSTIAPAKGVRLVALGSFIPMIYRRPIKVVDQPEALALGETKYSSIRSQPIIQAITSPKAA